MTDGGISAAEAGISPADMGISPAEQSEGLIPTVTPSEDDKAAAPATEAVTSPAEVPIAEPDTAPPDSPTAAEGDALSPTQDADITTEGAVEIKKADAARLGIEIGIVTQNSVLHKAEAAMGKIQGKTDEERQALYAEDPTLKPLADMERLHLFPTTSDEFLKAYPEGIDMTDGDKLEVVYNNKRFQVTRIRNSSTEGDQQYFGCTLRSLDGLSEEPKTVNIPREDVIRGQFLQDYEKMRNAFSAEEQVIIDRYVDLIRGEAVQSDEVDTLSEAVTKAADAAGVITTADIVHGLTSDGRELTPTLKKALATLEGNIFDETTATAFFSELGISQDRLEEVDIPAKNAEIAEIQKLLKANPGNDDIIKVLNEKRGELLLLRSAAAGFAAGGIEKYFEQLDEGTLDAEKGIELKQAFRSGDISSVRAALIDEIKIDPNDPEDVRTQKEKMLDAFQTAATGTGIGAMLLLMAALGSYQAIQKTMK